MSEMEFPDPSSLPASDVDAGRLLRESLACGSVPRSLPELADFLQITSEVLCAVTFTGKLVWWNQALERTLGYGADELAEASVLDYLHPDDVTATAREADLLRAGGETACFRNRYRRRDATWCWFEWTARAAPRSGLVYVAGRDVTARVVAERALADSEARLHAILDHAFVGVLVKDLEGRYQYVNEMAARLLGWYGAKDVIGKTALEVWGRFDDAPGAVAEKAVIETGRPSTIDEEFTVEGQTRDLMVLRFLVKDAAGSPNAVCVIAADITERKQAERALAERERLLETILRTSPDIIAFIGTDGQTVEVSEASKVLLGRNLAIPSSAADSSLVHPADLPDVYRAFADLLTGGCSEVDLRYRARHRDGRWITFDTRGQALVDVNGRLAGAVTVSRDVSREIDIQRQLREAVDSAEKASRAKSEFLSRMSHELRTPLNSVLGFAQLLQMDELAPAQVDAVDHILRAGRHLLDLIDEVLDIARIEAGHFDLSIEPIDLAEVVADATGLTRPLAQRAGVDVVSQQVLGFPSSWPSPTWVMADRQRVLQVLLNLLSNAVKYNVAGGSVHIRWGQTGSRGDRVRLSVTDTGPGIEPSAHARVFEPFDRLGAERAGVEGTGVGLALTRQLMEQMGGAMGLDSVPGVGSTFWIELRATVVAPRPPVPDAVSGSPYRDPATNRMRVLCMEDNLANQALVESVLARRGNVEVMAAAHGGRGLDLVREHRPQLVLLDLHLPDIEGTEVLRRLKADPATAEIPVVVMSADATSYQSRSLKAQGASACLTKPIDIRELLMVVDRMVPGP